MITNDQAIAETKKWFPELKVTIDPTLNDAKGSSNPKKLADIKKILRTLKTPLPK